MGGVLKNPTFLIPRKLLLLNDLLPFMLAHTCTPEASLRLLQPGFGTLPYDGGRFF